MKIRHHSHIFIYIAVILLASFGCAPKKVLIAKDKESGAYYKFGLAYLNENPPKTHQAYVEFIKAVEADPQNKDAYHALGHLYFLRQEYAKAIDAFQKALRIDPNFSEASNYLGKSLELSGRDEEAIIAYQGAANNLQYETPQLPHWNLALLYKKQKRYEMALSELADVRRVEPNNSIVLHEIGDTYIKMGTPALARPFYEEATKISPNDHRAYYLLASFYLQEGLSLEASEAFQKVIELSPESEEAEESRKKLSVMKGDSYLPSPFWGIAPIRGSRIRQLA